MSNAEEHVHLKNPPLLQWLRETEFRDFLEANAYLASAYLVLDDIGGMHFCPRRVNDVFVDEFGYPMRVKAGLLLISPRDCEVAAVAADRT